MQGHGGHNASLVVANQRAMTAAIGLAERIDGDAILAMHAALLERTDPDVAGRWRDQQVWIGGGDLGPHGAAFVPPHHRRVPAAIADLAGVVVEFSDRKRHQLWRAPEVLDALDRFAVRAGRRRRGGHCAPRTGAHRAEVHPATAAWARFGVITAVTPAAVGLLLYAPIVIGLVVATDRILRGARLHSSDLTFVIDEAAALCGVSSSCSPR